MAGRPNDIASMISRLPLVPAALTSVGYCASNSRKPRAVVCLDRLEGQRERLADTRFSRKRRDMVGEAVESLEAMLARQDQFGIGLRQRSRRGYPPRKPPRNPDETAAPAGSHSLAGAEHAEHSGRAVAVILQIGLERMAQFTPARHAFFSRLTPGGGAISSGTKKSTCSGCDGSARYP